MSRVATARLALATINGDASGAGSRRLGGAVGGPHSDRGYQQSVPPPGHSASATRAVRSRQQDRSDRRRSARRQRGRSDRRARSPPPLAGGRRCRATRPAPSAPPTAPMPWAASSASVIAPSRLARRRPSGRRRGARGRSAVSAVATPGRGRSGSASRQQVVAAHDERRCRGGVVDDDGEVVGGDAVVAAQHDVPRHALDGAGDDVVEGDGTVLGAEAQGRRAARPAARCADGRSGHGSVPG